jgi:hypothetical protein
MAINIAKGIGLLKNFKITQNPTYLKKICAISVNIYESVAIFSSLQLLFSLEPSAQPCPAPCLRYDQFPV